MPPRGSSTSVSKLGRPSKPSPRAITPEYVDALKSYSRLLFDGGLHGGKDSKRPEAIAAKIEVGRDLGIPATQAIAWIAIINGRPSIYGDLGMGLIRSSGLLAEGYPKEWYEGDRDEDDFTAVFAVKRVGQSDERVVRFSVGDAKKARLWGKAGPWSEYPDRQLMWRAKGFACRDEFQDVLCGLIFAEEAMDAPQQNEPTPRVVVSTDVAVVDASDVAASPPSPALPPASPITDEQLERLADLRELVWSCKQAHDEETRDAVWKETLADFGAESARELTSTQAAELIETLGKANDPFTHPPEQVT